MNPPPKPDTAIRPLAWEDYAASHDARHSADSLRWDDPNRPIPELEADRFWWRASVVTGKALVYGIFNPYQHLIGVINAFSHDIVTADCETGIVIFPASQWRLGHGKAAYRLFLPIIRTTWQLRQTHVETNVLNQAALGLFAGLGYQPVGIKQDGGIDWQVLVLRF